MQTDESIPYNRPDYENSDLINKELINGTFAKAILAEVGSFKAPMDRYNVTQDNLINMSMLKGNITPESYDISLSDMSLDGIKESCWLPAKQKINEPEPEVVYDPKERYTLVEWVGVNSTDLPDIPSSSTVGYLIDTPYYNDDNPGLFGFKTIKNEEGEITERYAVFSSIKNNYAISVLGQFPQGLNFYNKTYVGYVKGAFIFAFTGGTYVSFTMDSGVFILPDFSGHYNPLGDDGLIAIEGFSGVTTFVFDVQFNTVSEIDGRFCYKELGYSSSHTKYPFGTKIGSKYYFLKDSESSYKIWESAIGWRGEVVDKKIWAYQKRIKYDYATDNWLNHPLKTLHYNMVKNGIFVQNSFPAKVDEVTSIEFPNSDMHGDFARVTYEDGSRKVFHTFDFKKWEEVTGDAATNLYGCQGRMWFNGKPNGVSGVMPYTMAVKDVNNLMGGRKTVLQFSGFIFRGGTR